MTELSGAAPTGEEFVFTRTFDASREMVWDAFTRAEHLRHWWGPKGCSVDVERLEFRPGGEFLYCMRFPNGKAMWGKFKYEEIAAPERFVFINSFSDEAGGLTPNPWIPEWPLEVLTTVEFVEESGQTTITLSSTPIRASESQCRLFVSQFDSMRGGFGGTFERLAEYLESVPAEK